MSVGGENHNPKIPFLVVGLLAAAFSLGSALAADFTGQVISVLDGDTIEVLHNQHPEHIRLSGIDRPEKGTDILRANCSGEDKGVRN